MSKPGWTTIPMYRKSEITVLKSIIHNGDKIFHVVMVIDGSGKLLSETFTPANQIKA